MMWNTHIFGGFQAGILVAAVTNADPKTAALQIGAATLGSILPDIDQPNSKISRSDIVLSTVSKNLSKVTKHRREVHTIWASAIFALIAALFLFIATSASATGFSVLAGLITAIIIDLLGLKIGIPMGLILFFLIPNLINFSLFTLDKNLIFPIALSVFFGCISHLLYDTINIQGIMWLHPFKKKRYKLGRIQTQSKEETFFRVLMVMITLILFVAIQPLGLNPINELFNNKEIFLQ